MEIVRGTTPTIQFTFSTVNVGNITDAYLVLKQKSRSVEKPLESAIVDTDGNTVSFKLTQTDTLSLTVDQGSVMLDWKLSDGTRGRSEAKNFSVSNPGKDEVI